MKKRAIILCCAMIFLFSRSICAEDNKAHADLSWLDGYMNLSDDEFSLNKVILQLSDKADLLGKGNGLSSSAKGMELLSMRVKNDGVAKETKDPEERIRNVMFYEAGFSYDGNDPEYKDPANLDMESVLFRKKGACMGLSLVFLMLAEKEGLPLKGAASFNHFYVVDERNGSTVAFEMSKQGMVVNESFYRKKFYVEENDPVYLRPLNKKQIVSMYLSAMSTVFLDRGDDETAKVYLDKAIELMPDNSNALGNVAVMSIRRAEVSKGITILEKLVRKHPRVPFFRYHLGLGYLLQGNENLAVANFEAAVREDPAYSKARAMLVLFECRKLDKQEAIARIKAELETRGDESGFLYWELGNLYVKTGERRKAIEVYRSGLQKNPGLAILRELIIEIWTQLGEGDQAVHAAQEYVRVVPRYNNAYFNLGRAYEKNGDRGHAFESYKKAYELDGPDWVTLNAGMKVLAHYLRGDQAEEVKVVITHLAGLEAPGLAKEPQVSKTYFNFYKTLYQVSLLYKMQREADQLKKKLLLIQAVMLRPTAADLSPPKALQNVGSRSNGIRLSPAAEKYLGIRAPMTSKTSKKE